MFFLNYITSFRYFLSSEFTKVKNLLPWNLKANIHFKARFECLKIGMITFDITSLLGKLTLRTHKQRTFLQDYLANFKVSNIVTECDGGSLFVKINPVFFLARWEMNGGCIQLMLAYPDHGSSLTNSLSMELVFECCSTTNIKSAISWDQQKYSNYIPAFICKTQY